MTTEWLKKKRSGVLVDHRQNGHGKTIASVYSVRPEAGAPVSTPLEWSELTEGIRPRDFTMDVALDRVARRGDLFEPVLRGKPTARPRPARPARGAAAVTVSSQSQLTSVTVPGTGHGREGARVASSRSSAAGAGKRLTPRERRGAGSCGVR